MSNLKSTCNFHITEKKYCTKYVKNSGDKCHLHSKAISQGDAFLAKVWYAGEPEVIRYKIFSEQYPTCLPGVEREVIDFSTGRTFNIARRKLVAKYPQLLSDIGAY